MDVQSTGLYLREMLIKRIREPFRDTDRDRDRTEIKNLRMKEKERKKKKERKK